MKPPAVYNPCPSRELLQAKKLTVNTPHLCHPNRQMVVQSKIASVAMAPTRPKIPSPVYRAVPAPVYAVQRHPMVIDIGGRTTTSDTKEFLAEWEITSRIPSARRHTQVIAIHARKERRGDHQYLILTTASGYNLKMHLGVNGAVIEAGTHIAATYGEAVDEYTPTNNLTLLEAITFFYNLAHSKPFSSDDYNCRRFVAELAGKLGTWKRPEGGSEFDAFL